VALRVSELNAYAGEVEIVYTLKTRRLGRIQLPCRIYAVGSSAPPIEFVLAARSTGPILSFGSPDAPAALAAVSFGKVSVLDVHRQTLHMFNDSLIAANVKAFVAGKGSPFAIGTREVTLAPGEPFDLDVSVKLDETYAFNDVLHLLVEDGEEIEVPLSASGTGHTLHCADVTGHALLDLGDRFVGAPFTYTLVVRNHGRRAMNVQWLNVDVEATKKELGKELRGANGKPDASLIPADRQAAFAVTPEKGAIAPRQSLEFMLTGFAAKPRTLKEHLQMLAGTGAVRAACLIAPVAHAPVPLPAMLRMC
jgi:hydrocephalus-inducing protein